MLGNIAGVAEAADGTLYVLDRSWHKIVIFEPDGTFRGLILGGFGEGPGEFQVPRSLALSPGGIIGVLDEVPRRISLFSPSGDYLDAIPLESRLPLSMTLTDDTAWVLHATYVVGQPAVVGYDLRTREPVVHSGAADTITATWMLHGESGALGPHGEGLVWALPRTGRLRLISKVEDRTQGTPILPNVAPVVEKNEHGSDVYWVAEGTHGVKAGFRGTYVIHRRMQGRIGNFTNEYLVTVYDEDLANPKYYSLGTDRLVWGAGFAASRAEDAVYVGISEEFPQVHKFSLPPAGQNPTNLGSAH